MEWHALVNPFPHAASGNAWCAFDDLPLPVMVFKRDAQGVAILGEDDRAVEMLVESANLACGGVVGRVDRGLRWESLAFLALEEFAEVAAHLWIAIGTGGVELVFHVIAQFDADVGEGILIAQTPYQHRGVVLVTAYGGLCALLEHRVIGRVGEMLVAKAEGHLIDDVETQRVGQLIEAGFSGIV